MTWPRPPSAAADWVFTTIFVPLTVFFCYFYTAVTFPVDVADNLKKQGPSSQHPPGKPTADYIERCDAHHLRGRCTWPWS